MDQFKDLMLNQKTAMDHVGIIVNVLMNVSVGNVLFVIIAEIIIIIVSAILVTIVKIAIINLTIAIVKLLKYAKIKTVN